MLFNSSSGPCDSGEAHMPYRVFLQHLAKIVSRTGVDAQATPHDEGNRLRLKFADVVTRNLARGPLPAIAPKMTYVNVGQFMDERH